MAVEKPFPANYSSDERPRSTDCERDKVFEDRDASHLSIRRCPRNRLGLTSFSTRRLIWVVNHELPEGVGLLGPSEHQHGQRHVEKPRPTTRQNDTSHFGALREPPSFEAIDTGCLMSPKRLGLSLLSLVG